MTDQSEMKIIKLKFPDGDKELGLAPNESFYAAAHADGVKGLTEAISQVAPVYELATKDANGLLSKELFVKLSDLSLATSEKEGLLSKEDKAKLDQINPQDIEKRLQRLETQLTGGKS